MSSRGWAASFAAGWCLVAFALAPTLARAAGAWPWPAGSMVSLGYGAAYTAQDGRLCSHGGIDIPVAAGESVRAAASGRVSFAGLVPAGRGRRVFAVTVLTGDGLRVTYMPIERVAVRSGETVVAGGELGVVASEGDASSPGTHLHFGVRRGERAIDPMSLLAQSGAAPVAQVVTPRDAGSVRGPGLPVRVVPSRAPARGAPAVTRTPVRGTARATVPAGTASPSVVQSVRAAAASARHALSIRPPEPLPPAASSPELQVVRIVADAVSARNAVAGVIVRVLVAALGFLCLRPVLRSVTTRPLDTVPVPVAAPRTRA
ncbi:MAG: M23 family metallopeptidase [Coriobacteriia bacterium]|nr:M23 family metallopeptidase [Coriobacteriia bacterium]